MVAHLLRTNDWMETNNFPEEAKVQRFCVTLTGERPDDGMENSKTYRNRLDGFTRMLKATITQNFGSTREPVFPCMEIIPFMMKIQTLLIPYICKIKQVAVLLNYGEPQILELLKNSLPSKLYWILFPINNLRDVVDDAKRVLTKEKLDKHFSGQTVNSTPFMKM